MLIAVDEFVQHPKPRVLAKPCVKPIKEPIAIAMIDV
jgi:hypothetical protein